MAVVDDSDDSKYSKRNLALQSWGKVNVGALAISTAISVAQQRPVLVSVWAFGLLLAAFAGGLPVDEAAKEGYSVMLQHAEVIDSREFQQHALVELESAEKAYYQARGWFGACDADCGKARDRLHMAEEHAGQVQRRRDEALSEARHEVGIWSSFGVQDVRASFWAAWKSGKDFAARCTMYDAIFMVGGRDETLATMVFKLILQYVVNLSVGLIGAFFFFMYSLYGLIVSYGSSFLTGAAFFLLVAVAGLSLIGTYLGGMYGAVVGGGIMLMQYAEQQQEAIEMGNMKGKRRRAVKDNPNDSDKDVV